MDPAKWHEIEEIFHDASRKPAEERALHIETACRGDEDLKKEVLALLAAQEEAGDFMDKPPLEKKVDLDTATSLIDAEERSFVGREIGPYRLEDVIAAGGMGTVYLAARTDESFQKKVAVKLIRGGLLSREIIRRFYRERQTLANLDHINIARLLDGGTSDDGHPYLVMEFIEGTAIDTYCDSHVLTVNERLDIFLKVCAAVQYAHGKLVVHRDIKPGNILVTEDGIPKLLDFGIVKILDPEAEPSAAITLTVQRLMTPEYASPEQIRGDTISTATDVYSLGIVLYELLTGHRPYRFESRSAMEVERIVCKEDPPRPSAVVTEVVQLSTPRGDTCTLTPDSVSRTREGRPDRLRRRLVGDLDHIVMKALRKEPEKRYTSVEHFAEDIRRHLARLPVHARRGTWRYRAGKCGKRNKTAALAAGLILLATAVACYFGIADSRRAADQEAAQQVLDFLTRLYENPLSERTPREQVRETLEAKHTLELARDLSDQPEELLRFAAAIYQICEGFHLDDLAVQWRRISFDTYRSSLPPDDPVLLNAQYQYAQALRRTGRFEEAARQVTALLDQQEGSHGIVTLFPGKLNHLLAAISWDQGNYREPEDLFEKSLRLLSNADGSPSCELVAAMLDFAGFLDERGDFEKAGDLYRRALAAANKIPAEPGRLAAAEVYHKLGTHLWRTPGFERAEIHIRGALEIYQGLLPEWDHRIAACLNDLFSLLLYSKQKNEDFDECSASAFWKKSWKIRQKVFGDQSFESADSLFLIAPELTFGSASNALSRNAVDQYSRLWSRDHPKVTVPMVWLGASLSDIKRPRMETDTLLEGEELLREALAVHRKKISARHWCIGHTKVYLGINFLKQSRFQEGAALISDGLDILQECYGERHPLLIRETGRAALACKIWGLRDDEKRYRDRIEGKSATWPYGEMIRDCDFSCESWARIDFEDDHIEKTFDIDQPLDEKTTACLWIYGQPRSWMWRDFEERENIRIRVNHDPSREISFNVLLKYGSLTGCYQWVPFEIPVSWLRNGTNTFVVYVVHDADYVRSRSWECNNLRIGVDLDNDDDHSWWFGSSETPCCSEMGQRVIEADKPISRDDPMIIEHRKVGYRECRGELMMMLEID